MSWTKKTTECEADGTKTSEASYICDVCKGEFPRHIPSIRLNYRHICWGCLDDIMPMFMDKMPEMAKTLFENGLRDYDNRYRPRERKRIPPDVRQKVLDRDGGCCQECGDEENLAVDHIMPISKGGSDCMDNLQILCRACNSSKGAK